MVKKPDMFLSVGWKNGCARFLLTVLLLVGQTHCLFAGPKQKWVAFDLSLGVGYSTLGYHVQSADMFTANATGSWGMRAGVGVSYFFSDYFGMGIGASLTRFGGGMSLKGSMVWEGVTDTDGERYDHLLQINRWRETQQQLFLAPNLTLQSAFPVGNVRMLLRLGAEYAFSLQASYRGYGELTHTGYYHFGNLTLHDIDKYGFYTTDRFQPSGELDADVQQVSVIGAVGVGIPMAKKIELSIAVEAAYAVWSSAAPSAGGQNPIGFHENVSSQGGQDYHYFIPDYVSLTTTSLVNGKIRPFYIGLQVGLRFCILQRKRYPCMCFDPSVL